MKSLYFLFQGFLSLLLLYSFFAVAYISLFKQDQLKILTLFFILTLFVFNAFSFLNIYKFFQKKSLKKTSERIKTLFNHKGMVILALCFTSLLIGLINVSMQYHGALTIAENGQFHLRFTTLIEENRLTTGKNETSHMRLSGDIVEAAYMQQQPPLDYYFSGFSYLLFGNSKWAMRFHAMLFYLILSFLLPLGLYFFCSSFWISAGGAMLFLINHIIRLHSVNARPLNLALLAGFLFLFFYLDYCRKDTSDKKSLFPVLASQYLFVMSIGLQPVIFIISLFVSSFWLLLDKKKTIFKNLFLSHLATALLTLPFLFSIWSFGLSAYKFKVLSLNSIGSYMAQLNTSYFMDKYFVVFYNRLSIFFFMFIMWLVLVAFKRWTMSKKKQVLLSGKPLETSTLMALSAMLLFPLFYDPVFHLGIHWSFCHHYIITFHLMVILFAVFSLKEINDYAKIVKRRSVYLAPLFITFIVGSYLQIQVIKNKTRYFHPYVNNNIYQEVYDYLKEKGSPKDLAIEFYLRPVVSYRQTFIHSGKWIFYDANLHPSILLFPVEYTKTPPFFNELPFDYIHYIDWKKYSQKIPQKMFFICDKVRKDEVCSDILPYFMKGHETLRYIVFEHTLSGSDKEKEYIQLLSQINAKTPAKYRGAVLETLIYYSFFNKDRKEFDRWLKEYESIETALDEFTFYDKYPSRFELKRRVKYFKNLKWNESALKSL